MAILLLEATCQQELDDVVAAVGLIHRRFCALCAGNEPAHVSIERVGT
jgi:hypothetical protein